MTLEAQTTCGGIIFLARIERDLAHQRLTFHLLGSVCSDGALSPALGPVVRVLEFTNVENFEEAWDEAEDPRLVEQIIGIIEHPQAQCSSYIVRLDQSEMHFQSCAQPAIRDLAGAVA